MNGAREERTSLFAGSRAGTRHDFALVTLLAALAFVSSWAGSALTLPAVCDRGGIDHWFEADTSRVCGNLLNRDSNHYRASVHPLFSLFGHAAVTAVRGLGAEPVTALRLPLAGAASLWIASMWIVFRALGISRLDAVVYCVLAVSSAASVFFFAVPESHPYAAATVVAPYAVLALHLRALSGARAPIRVIPGWTWVFASAASLSVTVTNWMFGWAAVLAALPWRRALRISAFALLLVCGLSGIQRAWIPSAPFFGTGVGEMVYVRPPGHAEHGGLVPLLANFALHGMVMPKPYLVIHPELPRRLSKLMVQHAAPGSGSWAGAVAVWSWLLLLCAGIFTAARGRAPRAFVVAIAVGLAGQLVLHSFYASDQAFLFSLHFVPILLILAGLTSLGPMRVPGLLLAGFTAFFAAINNWQILRQSADYIRAIPPLGTL